MSINTIEPTSCEVGSIFVIKYKLLCLLCPYEDDLAQLYKNSDL